MFLSALHYYPYDEYLSKFIVPSFNECIKLKQKKEKTSAAVFYHYKSCITSRE